MSWKSTSWAVKQSIISTAQVRQLQNSEPLLRIAMLNSQSSTSPHLWIWLETSTCAATAASSTVICLFTRASAIKKDFVVYVTRSMAKMVNVVPLASMIISWHSPANSQGSISVKMASSLARVSADCEWNKIEVKTCISMLNVDVAHSINGSQCLCWSSTNGGGSSWWKLWSHDQIGRSCENKHAPYCISIQVIKKRFSHFWACFFILEGIDGPWGYGSLCQSMTGIISSLSTHTMGRAWGFSKISWFSHSFAMSVATKRLFPGNSRVLPEGVFNARMSSVTASPSSLFEIPTVSQKRFRVASAPKNA